MRKPAENIARDKARTILVLWALLALYTVARILQIFPGRVPMSAVVILHVAPAAIFALIHGAMFYGTRSILIFIAGCLVIGNIFETLGVLTGFPYGHYYFRDLMGPKLFVVPILLGLAYVGMAYVSWTLARLILRVATPLAGWHIVILPFLASFITVAWDLAMEPIWGTVLRAWIWVDGGPTTAFPSATS